MAPDESEKARRKAYRLLALRSHSEGELEAKLKASGFSEAAMAGALARCRGLGYLDDGKYARQRARDLAVNRLYGDRRISADLRGKGISEALLREAIAAAREELGAGEAIGRLLAKQGAAPDEDLDRRRKERLIRGLMARGFSRGLIFSVFKDKNTETGEDGFHGDDGE
ncbi:MAG: recombination regulator RecX [Syntrophaceae bacterium]|nr:recombination regulator RecX [Syntrophaceae bacterium]